MINIDSNPPDARTPSIRNLNDRFRQTFKGGRVAATAGIMALDEVTQRRFFIAVQRFNAFDEGNDPWGEHDFGSIETNGKRVFFKIDYLTPGGSMHSEDPADLAKTERVMTIMLASEY